MAWASQYNLYFADSTYENIHPSIPETNKILIPKALDSSSFISHISEICENKNIHIVVPGVDEELPLMENIIKKVSNIDVLAPCHEHILLCLDKYALMNELDKQNILIPKTFLLSDKIKLQFPIFIKPRTGRGSRGAQKINSENEMQNYLSLSPYQKDQLIVQELLGGCEYTVMMSSNKNGELKAIVPVRVDLKKGITLKAQIENNEAIIKQCKKMHNSLNFKGCYNIQLFLTEQNEAYPIEINPRVSTTFCLSVAAGIDPINLYYDFEKKDIFCSAQAKKLYRYWYNHII